MNLEQEKLEKRRAQWRRYSTSEKGKARRRRANARYYKTEKGREARRVARWNKRLNLMAADVRAHLTRPRGIALFERITGIRFGGQ